MHVLKADSQIVNNVLLSVEQHPVGNLWPVLLANTTNNLCEWFIHLCPIKSSWIEGKAAKNKDYENIQSDLAWLAN